MPRVMGTSLQICRESSLSLPREIQTTEMPECDSQRDRILQELVTSNFENTL
jgi:hypothetical protein